MKLKVKKLQTGGGMPFTVYSPTEYYTINPYIQGLDAMRGGSQQSQQGGSQKSGSGLDLLPEQVVNELMKKGLPNDINAFLAEARKLEQSGPFTSGMNRASVYNLAALANQAIFNRSAFDNATERAESQGSLSEIAFSANQGVYVQDNGKVKHVSFADYTKNKEKYIPLTIGQLMQARAYSPNAAWDSTMVETIQQSVGMSEIQKQISSIITTIGSTETSQEEYVSLGSMLGGLQTPSQAEKSGLEILANTYNQSPEEAIVKIKQSSKNSNIRQAAEYIWKVLPKNSKNTIIGNWVLSGGSKEDSVEEILSSALMMANKSEEKTEIEFQKPTDQATGGAKGKTHAQTPLEQFFDGNINQNTFTLTDGNYKNRYAIQLHGSTLSGITTDNGSAIGTAPLHLALDAQGRGMGKYLDYSKIYYGNKKISQAHLSSLMDSGKTIAQAWLPVNENGDIDFELMGIYARVQDDLKDKGILDMPNSPEKFNLINQEYYNNGLPIKLDSKGKPTSQSQVAQFLITHAYAENDDLAKGNGLVKEITGDEESELNDLMDQIFEQYKMESPVSMMNNAYIAPVFIKINPSAQMDVQTYAGHGSQVQSATLQDNMLRQELQRPTASPIIADASLLFNQ